MWALYKKEINSFFSSAIGYLVLMIFLAVNGLLLWFFNTGFNITESGYASLTNFFTATPWFFIVLIPAITMGMFSEEKRLGTFDILLTHPIKISRIFFAKYLATLTLVVLALLPSIVYVYSIYQLSLPVGNIDLRAIFGSYIGLLFIASSFSAIGMLASTFSSNQITAFLTSIIISISLYYGFELTSNLNLSVNLNKLGMLWHYESLGRALFDVNDLLYFTSITVIFSALSILLLQKNSSNKAETKSNYINLLKLIGGFAVLLWVSSIAVWRYDFTSDKRYTLKKQTINIVENTKSNTVIQIYLTGDLPYSFKRLENEVKRISNDFSRYNNNISSVFYNPYDITDTKKRNEYLNSLTEKGLVPTNLEINKNGEHKSKYIFPWAVIVQGKKTIRVNLLKSKLGASPEEQLNNSIENLEYAIVDALNKVNKGVKPKVGILGGHGELRDEYIVDFLKSQVQYYQFEKINLNEFDNTNNQQLNQIDAIVIAKPATKFSDKDKLFIDQYIMNGGNTMWLIDGVFADNDSLMQTGKTLAYARDLGLNQMLFRYGFRVNQNIVKDLQSAPIKLASGAMGSNVQYHTLPWTYTPISFPESNHPIVKNIEAVKFNFASSIDTILSPNVRKEILLKSSKYTRIFGVPNFIELNEVEKKQNQLMYNAKGKILGLLLEGNFTSAYKNRLLPYSISNYKNQSKNAKMIVYSDGDLIANDYKNGEPLPLGYDKWFNKQYGNKELMINSLSYLVDDSNILDIKRKEVTLRLLDKKKVKEEKTFWQLLNIIAPLFILLIFGIIFSFLRRKKYR
ncbi:MAG: gliding motility-associated ABC transporter substrate-binding protein GldG [Ichthyobacteriaceae bacterium]|nr:gliding motility-associated ABC transporter substrate-binding protein GldG [Ichthyobacteriaceae bacterium]